MSKIETCAEFVTHPHIVEQKIYSMNGAFIETREGGCYQCQMASASDDQGVNAIAEAFDQLNIPNDIHQTGGFNMCNYIKTGDESYIYANDEGFSFYEDENCEGWFNWFYESETTPLEKAQALVNGLKEQNLKALKI